MECVSEERCERRARGGGGGGDRMMREMPSDVPDS